MAWRIAWDAPGEAAEFEETHGQMTGSLPFPTSEDSASATETLVLHASSAALLDRLETLLAD
jgi:hypothetical protein